MADRNSKKNFLGSLVTKVTYEITTILIVGNAHPKNAIKKLSRSYTNGWPQQQEKLSGFLSDKGNLWKYDDSHSG